MDCPYIRTLLNAEDQAKAIVDSALRTKNELLTQIESASTQEAEIYKNELEMQFDQEIKKTSSKDEDTDLEKRTREDVEKIYVDYNNRKQDVIDFLIAKILDVDLTLPSVIKKNLTMLNKK